MTLFFYALLFVSITWGQSSSKIIDRIARDQQVVHQRLDNIQKKMKRLINKDELEGRQHTADLIRRARAELEKRDLVKRIEDLDNKIRNAQLTVIEEQAAVLKDLDDVFAVLQDRSDLERLEDMLNTFQEAMQRIGELIDEQDHLLTETRQRVYDASALAEANLNRLEELLDEQRILNARTEKAAEKSEPGDELWEMARQLESMAGKELSLTERAASQMESAEDSQYHELADEQREAETHLESAVERMRDTAEKRREQGAPDESVTKAFQLAADEAEKGREAMGEAADRFAEDAPAEGIDAGEEAAEQLQKASRTLTEAGSEMHRNRMKENYDLAGQQDYVRQKMQELKGKLGVQAGLDPKGAQEKNDRLRKSEAVLDEMEKAGKELHEDRPKEAGVRQDNAMQLLEELKKSLEQDRESASKSENSLSNEEREKQLRDLAKEQKALEEKTRDLMRRLRDLPDNRPGENLSKASDNMAGAASELSQNQGEGAEQEEEEAKKYLEKARKEIFEEENKYQNIRQQEVLFRVQQELEDLKVKQDEIMGETLELDQSRGGEQRLTRRQQRTLRELTGRELDLYGKTGEVKDKIEEDEATVFSWVLARNLEDISGVAESLQQQDTGPLVQNIQKDISDRFAELIESLKRELKRRSEAEPPDESSPSSNQPQKNPLIPPVAELLMIKRME
ncbi:MAG: hypothetical protein ABIK28_15000, partial [Planctomycetota bacterium]